MHADIKYEEWVEVCVGGAQLMPEREPINAGAIGPLDWLKTIPFQAVATSDRLGWSELEAARYHASPAWEYNAPALTQHRLVLVTRPPQELDLRFDEVKRHVPPPAARSRR
jgi:hypothetical protein